MRPKGILITLEGNEGCGKSTQIRLLYDYLKKKRRAVFLTCEPGGTKIGEAVRALLLDKKNKKMSPHCETMLYMASRAQLVDEVIRGKLAEGSVVLCDRWLDATVAYQGYGNGVDVEWIKSVGKKVTQGAVPTLSFFLDLGVRNGLRRAKRRGAQDRIEKQPLSFHQRVRIGYLQIAKNEPQRFVRIPVSVKDSPMETHNKIIKELKRVLGYQG